MASGAEAFFETCMALVRGSAGPSIEARTCDLDLGGDRIRLMFSSAGLGAKLTRAMNHVRARAEGAPDLVLHVWDSRSSGVPMPRSPWSGESYEAHGRRYQVEEGRTLYRDERYLMFFCLREQVVLLDFAGGTGLVWIPDATNVPSYEQAAPLIFALPKWLAGRGKFLVHAAAVGSEDGVALLVGAGGSGKSTTALLSLTSGMGYSGDDYCLMSLDPEPKVISLYGSAKIHWENLSRVAPLFGDTGCPRLDEGDKAVLFVNEAFPARMLRTAPIKVVVLPRVVPGSPTRIVPIAAAAGLKALAPSSLFQMVGTDPRSFGAMASLVRRVPCFRLEIGTDGASVPDVLRAVLKSEK